MEYDPIVAEVRAIRDAYARRFNYDLVGPASGLPRPEGAGKDEWSKDRILFSRGPGKRQAQWDS
jgi:hypothetical protein